VNFGGGDKKNNQAKKKWARNSHERNFKRLNLSHKATEQFEERKTNDKKQSISIDLRHGHNLGSFLEARGGCKKGENSSQKEKNQTSRGRENLPKKKDEEVPRKGGMLGESRMHPKDVRKARRFL